MRNVEDQSPGVALGAVLFAWLFVVLKFLVIGV